MLRLGEKQTLTIEKKVDFGVYLSDGEEKVLLPRKEVPKEAQVGDEMTVFLYRDSKDRMIATTREPYLTLYHTAVLKVKEVGKIGAFLDWGLEKDLLLPFREQTRRVKAGEECLVALYPDKSRRLCATMNVYRYLGMHSPYQPGDEVKGRVYETSGNFGIFVAVDDKYSALIPKKEAAGTHDLKVGDIITARVTDVKEDGKLDLSIRKKAYLQMEDDAELVMKAIDSFDGVLPFGEETTPAVIERELGLSKKAFKRALGRLLRQGRIEIGENRIYRKD